MHTTRKPRWIGVALLFLVSLGNNAVTADVVINEIFYNEPGSVEDGEFVELLNTSSTATVDLAGVSFSQGIEFEFSAGTTLGPRDLIVVAASETTLQSRYPSARIAGSYTGRLSNSGERLTLIDSAGGEIDSVDYNDNEDWPAAADGDGASLELIKTSVRNDFPGNWAAGDPPTPGAPNRNVGATLPALIYDVEYTPRRVTSFEPVVVTARAFSEGSPEEVFLRTFSPVTRDYVMSDNGVAPDMAAGDGIYTVSIPPQPNRSLVRFKVGMVEEGSELLWPRGDDESDFYAWFVYDGDIETNSPIIWIFLSEAKLQILHDNAQVRSFGDPRFPHFDDEYPGFVVIDGRVHRKVFIRHRGGFASRHAAGLKFSWRLSFPDWDRYEGRRTIIVQGNMHWDDRFMRGDNGLQDKLCFMTFDRAGVPSTRTRFIRLMVNNNFFGYHVELEAIDEEFLERNGFSARGDLYKHGRTVSAHNFPIANYASGYEKKTNDRSDYSSIRNFVEQLAAASSGNSSGSMEVVGRIWKRDGGVRPATPTFRQSGLGEFSTGRASVGFMAYGCLAEFDNLQVTGADNQVLLTENGLSIDDWTHLDGNWESSSGVVRLDSPNARVHHRIAKADIIDFDSGQPITVQYDVRITSPKTGDNWAGFGLFMGDAPGHTFNGTLCPSLRYLNESAEGLHLVNAGVRWIHQSGQFAWNVGEWCRVEYTVTDEGAGGGESGVLGFFNDRVQLDRYIPYVAAIILSTHWDSTSQNYFFYQDDLAENRWVRFPWDMDITWGYSRRKAPPAQGHNVHPYDGTRFNPEPHEFMTNALRQALIGEPQLRERLHDALELGLAKYFTETEIHPVVDRILEFDGEESQMDVDRWNALDTTWNWHPFLFHARFDKQYVSSRRKYLAEFLDRAPILSQPWVGPEPARPGDELTFEVNALGSCYEATYDLGASNLEAVRVHVVTPGGGGGGGAETTLAMTATDARRHDFYRASMLAPAVEETIYYRFSARDDDGRASVLPDPERDGFEYYALDLGTDEPRSGDVVINEIMYNSKYYNVEFIELKNNLYRALDLSGWKLVTGTGGSEYVLPPGSLIEPAGFLVLSRDTRGVFEFYNIVQLAATDMPFSLSNAGEEIGLFGDTGALIDRVDTDDAAPWPTAPDGDGPSLELMDSRAENNVANAWGASHLQGTPGRPNSIAAPEIPPQPGDPEGVHFHRGDANDDGGFDVSDAIFILAYLFSGGLTPHCLETADVNNDGGVEISDGIFALNFLFGGGPAPAPPGSPREPCGPDPDEPGTDGDLGCSSYAACE